MVHIFGLTLAGNFNSVSDLYSLTVVGFLSDPLAKSLVVKVVEMRHGDQKEIVGLL